MLLADRFVIRVKFIIMVATVVASTILTIFLQRKQALNSLSTNTEMIIHEEKYIKQHDLKLLPFVPCRTLC